MTAFRRFAAAVLVALCGIAGNAAPALSHATLLKAEPRDGAMLPTAPTQLSLTFNEPVAPLVFRLLGPDGGAIALTPTANNETVTLTAREMTAQGTYLLSWRVVSADGHPVGGAYAFSVGRRSTSPATQTQNNRPLTATIWLSRVAIYAGLFIGIGGAFFASFWRAPLRPLSYAAIVAVLGVALAAVPLSIGLQGTDALDASLKDIWRPDVLNAGLRTSYGLSALIAAASLAAALVSLHITALGRALAFTAAIGVACALAASGHASNATPQWLMRPSVFVHAMAILFWAGSLVPLLGLYSGRGQHRSLLARYSNIIPYAVGLLLLTGLILSIVQVREPAALWKTAYGQVFLVKLFLLAALALLAAYNRFWLTPGLLRGTKRTGDKFRRSLIAEIACILLIFAVVALWRFTPPPRALAASEPFFVHLHDGRAMADV
ncbi:MAG: CopD family protein, partial [Pseudolabrys sp.]|nr:CopD family protein [Pseudolabrys sp.]